MNKIERHLVERAKRILKEYATEEIEKYKKELTNKKNTMLLDVFNSGIFLDINRLKIDGLNQLEKKIEKHFKKSK